MYLRATSTFTFLRFVPKYLPDFLRPYFSVSRWPVITGRKQSCVHCPRPCWAVSSQLKQLIGRLDPTFSLNGKLAVSKNQSSAGQFLRPFCLEKSHFQAQVNTMDENIKETLLQIRLNHFHVNEHLILFSSCSSLMCPNFIGTWKVEMPLFLADS